MADNRSEILITPITNDSDDVVWLLKISLGNWIAPSGEKNLPVILDLSVKVKMLGLNTMTVEVDISHPGIGRRINLTLQQFTHQEQ
ncbi:14553_t:CDS:2 [Funneliformis geosporum]|uniref:18767_t:CDS:1 n=1 Tax=Funneliformis geosporum TaxID=1117311 RepID=A0A9W4X1Q7_9GLOM|nr:14553_t:CDS:2 [Funneliformis geosporum]CAI2188799.1 18767_t:CDS:2 [Funneliformis geosporum]